MGGVGFTKDYPIEKYYRDCKIGEHSFIMTSRRHVGYVAAGETALTDTTAGSPGVAVCDWTRVGWDCSGCNQTL